MKISEEKFNKVVSDLVEEQQVVTKDLDVDSLGYIIGHKLDDDYVLANEEQLAKSFSSMVSLYGFDSFYDMYLYAKSQDDIAKKSTPKRKDTSKLQLVQRTVMRRGKPTTLSFYEDTNKVKGQNQDDSKQEQSQEEESDPNLYRFLAGKTFGKPSTANIAKAKTPSNWQTPHDYQNNLYDYTFYVRNGVIVGVNGITKFNDTLEPVYVSAKSTDDYREVYYHTIMDILNEAYKSNLGFALVPETPDEITIAEIIMSFFDIKLSKGAYTVTAKELVKKFGEPLWES